MAKKDEWISREQIFCEHISGETEISVTKVRVLENDFTILGNGKCKYADDNGCKMKKKCKHAFKI